MKNIRDDVKKLTNKDLTGKDQQNDVLNEEQIKRLTVYESTEGIIKQIIDKIIISVVRTTQAKEIEEQMGNFCFNSLKHQMTSLFETSFINYTDDVTHQEPQFLWDSTPPLENTWVELQEPESQIIDRYESTNIEFIEIKKEQDKDLDTLPNTVTKQSEKRNNFNKKTGKKESEPLYLNNNNIISEVEEKSSISGFGGEVKVDKGDIPEISGIEDKVSESLDITDAEIKNNIDNAAEISKKEKNIQKEDNKNLENIQPKKEELNKNKEVVKKDMNKDLKIEEKKINTTTKATTNQTSSTLPPVKPKGKNIPLVDYPFSDIPGVEDEFNHDNLEPANVEFLRKEREQLILKRLVEKKNQEKENKVVKPKEENEKVKKKLIDTNRLTFDSNGNIIHFRPFKLDNLMKDFIMTKNTIKGIEFKAENIPSKKKNKDKKEKPKEVKKEEIIIKNTEEEGKIKDIKNFGNLNTDKENFIPSGSNFQIIAPNTGVIIKENNQSKEGSREFSKYFKKYSIQDYDKMLNDFVPLQNRTILKNQLSTSTNNNNSKYLSTAPNNSMLNRKPSNSIINSNIEQKNNINNTEIPNNPLLSSYDEQSYMIDKDKSINNNSSGLNVNNSAINNPLLPSNMNSMNLNRYNESYNTINMDNSIVMKKLGSSSLKLELENLKDLSTINPDLITLPSNRSNIFRSSYIKNNRTFKVQQPNKNVFSDFNKNIMATSGWGNDTTSRNEKKGIDDMNKVYARHMTKQQVLRELGSNILSGIKIRLPRDRKVDINSNI